VIELDVKRVMLISSKGFKAVKAVNMSVIWMEKDCSGEENGNCT
jgi:hypothetical protein